MQVSERFKYLAIKTTLYIMLRVPNFIYEILFAIAFPIYKFIHKKRAYGRVQKLLYSIGNSNEKYATIAATNPKNVFKGIFENALDSYRGLARLKCVTERIEYQNEHIITEALKQGPVAAISIHQGAFELLHRALCRYSKNVHLITDSKGSCAMRKCLHELRSDQNITEYSPNEVNKVVRNLFKTNGILAMVVDQARNTKGNLVKLFSKDFTLYLRLPQMVNNMGASIVTFRTFTECDNKKNKHIIIRFETYYPPKSGSELIAKIAKEIETWIIQHPNEWSWNYHKNFNLDATKKDL